MQGWLVHTTCASVLRCKLTEAAALQLPPDDVWQVAKYDSWLMEAYKSKSRWFYSYYYFVNSGGVKLHLHVTLQLKICTSLLQTTKLYSLCLE